MFQLTRPRGARRGLVSGEAVDVLVSTHAPARGATRGSGKARGLDGRFNSRAREGRDPPPSAASITLSRFQLTRPRGARPAGINDRDFHLTVSTHAPARGATNQGRRSFAGPRFQPTRPRGARRSESQDILNIHQFQLTRPRGARPVRGVAVAVGVDVSTHAPARGATLPRQGDGQGRGRFNSRAREGRDNGKAWYNSGVPGFNSRAREGRDSWALIAGAASSRFNSRAREGRDRASLLSIMSPGRFNSRAREGRDINCTNYILTTQSFNSRAREGRDRRVVESVGVAHHVSTHAPARGATSIRCSTGSRRWRFNSRAREGRDNWQAAPCCHSRTFQLPRPRGARPNMGESSL